MNFREFAQQQLTRMLNNPNTTLMDLREALNQVGEAVLQDLTMADVREIQAHTPKPKPADPEEPKTVLGQATKALKMVGEMMTAEDLAEMIDSSSVYVTKVLTDEITTNPDTPIIRFPVQIHKKGKPTPHFKYDPNKA